MELSTAVSIGSGVPQGAAALIFLWDRFRAKAPDAKITSNGRSLFLAVLLLAGVALTVGAGVWFHDHPNIIEKRVEVEKLVPIPCPITQQKNGPATVRGAGGIAHSGNGDTYAPSATPPKPQH